MPAQGVGVALVVLLDGEEVGVVGVAVGDVDVGEGVAVGVVAVGVGVGVDVVGVGVPEDGVDDAGGVTGAAGDEWVPWAGPTRLGPWTW